MDIILFMIKVIPRLFSLILYNEYFFLFLESYEFRNCLEACEVYEDDELKPDHNCIRQKCLKEITGI
jgi:hypothetical protein